jgi:hypothetical protein
MWCQHRLSRQGQCRAHTALPTIPAQSGCHHPHTTPTHFRQFACSCSLLFVGRCRTQYKSHACLERVLARFNLKLRYACKTQHHTKITQTSTKMLPNRPRCCQNMNLTYAIKIRMVHSFCPPPEAAPPAQLGGSMGPAWCMLDGSGLPPPTCWDHWDASRTPSCPHPAVRHRGNTCNSNIWNSNIWNTNSV